MLPFSVKLGFKKNYFIESYFENGLIQTSKMKKKINATHVLFKNQELLKLDLLHDSLKPLYSSRTHQLENHSSSKYIQKPAVAFSKPDANCVVLKNR